MTKLLDADWSRGVQLFQNKQNGGQAEFKYKRNCSRGNSPRRLVQFWQNFQTSLVLLIPNCTRQRMIPYTNRVDVLGHKYVFGPTQTHFSPSAARPKTYLCPRTSTLLLY